MQFAYVEAPDGVKLAAQEWGNPNGLEVVFLHGFNQSHLAYRRQVEDPTLAQELRMVTFDYRGHGSSDKPTDPASYRHNNWGDDLVAVIEAHGLKRPVIVGWSLSGHVILDYVVKYGTQNIAGINFVSALTRYDTAFFGPGRTNFPNLMSDELSKNIEDTRGFLEIMFVERPAEKDFEVMLAYNMVVPPAIRQAVVGRPSYDGVELDDAAALSAIDCPVLVTHGAQDQVVIKKLGEFTASAVQGSRTSFYEDAGHCSFWERPDRFNAELLAFAREANNII